MQYSHGFALTDTLVEAVDKVPKKVRTPAYDADGHVHEDAWFAEITGLVDLFGWPAEMRLSCAKNAHTPARSCDSPTSTGCG